MVCMCVCVCVVGKEGMGEVVCVLWERWEMMERGWEMMEEKEGMGDDGGGGDGR